jgi:hypothetical protein
VSEWQPIALAPHGTMVLVAFQDGRRRIGAYDHHNDSSYPMVWKDPNGSVLARPWKDDPEPTHWMPLPASPHNTEVR